MQYNKGKFCQNIMDENWLKDILQSFFLKFELNETLGIWLILY